MPFDSTAEDVTLSTVAIAADRRKTCRKPLLSLG
jgi:hypothetical protein